MIGTFRGSELTDIECDKIALDRIPLKTLSAETELSSTAWFDYRFMHPTHRTYLFASHYDKAFQYMVALHVDVDQVRGDDPRSFFPKGNDPLGKTKSTLLKESKSGVVGKYKVMHAVWKARQKADELGMPYDIFCMSGMKAAIGRIWQRIPSPQQLYSENIVTMVIERWAELLSERMFISENPFYELRNWVSHPDQIDHAQWVCAQVMQRSRPEMTLAQYAFLKPMIPAQVLRSMIPEHVIIESKRISKYLL